MGENSVGILLLGCRGAGKTSFLTGLSLLSRGGGGDSHFQAVPGDNVTAKLIFDLREQADKGEWPPPTSSMSLLECELTYKGQPFNVSLLDYPGEDFQAAMETLDFGAREEIRLHAAKAEYLLLVADPTQDLDTPVNVTVDRDKRRRQDALVQSVGYLFNDRRKSGDSLPNIAVVLSKADLLQLPALSDDQVLLQENRSFFDQIAKYSRTATRVPIFPVSVCGQQHPDSDRVFPPDAQPNGYDRLFDWMSNRDLAKRHGRKIGIGLAIAALACAIAVSIWLWLDHEATAFEHLLGQAPLEKVRDALARHDDLSEDARRALNARAEREMDTVESQIPLVTTDQAFQRLDDTLALLSAMQQLTQPRRLNELRGRIEGLREASLYASIAAAVRGDEDPLALKMIADYRQRFPTGAHLAEVTKLEGSIADERRSALRGQVQSVAVTDRAGLARKIGEIRQYLGTYPDDPDAERIRTGLRLAERLSAADSVRLVMTGCGFGAEAGERKHEIRWAAGRTDETAVLFRQEGSVAMSTFSAPMEIDHARWRPVRIQLWSTPLLLPNSLMASAELSVLHDAQRFDGKQRVALPTNIYAWDNVGAWVLIQLQLRGPGGWQDVPPAELEAYGRFVLPGEAWR